LKQYLLNRTLCILSILTLLVSMHPVCAQTVDTITKSKKIDHQISIIPLPVIAANPTNGWMFGVAPGATWMMGDPSTTSISSLLGTVIYTTNKQWIITLKANTFLKDDQYNLLTDMRYFITSQPTYGLGTGPQSAKPINGAGDFTDNPYNPIGTEQMMEFNYLRFHQTLLKRHEDTRFFYGLGYHLDYHYKIQDNLLNLNDSPQTITSHYAYSTLHGFDPTTYILSGVSFNLLYDSRDNAVNPYKGRYVFANIRVNPMILGSTKNSSILWLEYRDYIHFSKERPRHLLGFWTYGWFVTTGDVPYMDLPAVGWDQFGRSGRAYTQGRFRGQDMIYGETEYRFPLQKEKETFGGVVFLNATTASNRDANINVFKYINTAYGIGLRVMINKRSRANLNIDYAWGNYGAQGFYLGLNEVF
jgi:outer membrane protein assembly factor BamA